MASIICDSKSQTFVPFFLIQSCIRTSLAKMSKEQIPRIPTATYRLQMNRDFTFKHAKRILDYLKRLGISDVYLSPIFKARAGSLHGYDGVDYGEINAELGTRREFL